jgi:hypothetical protein
MGNESSLHEPKKMSSRTGTEGFIARSRRGAMNDQMSANLDTSASKQGLSSQGHGSKSARAGPNSSRSINETNPTRSSRNSISDTNSKPRNVERNLNSEQIKPASNRGQSNGQIKSQHMFTEAKRSGVEGPIQPWDTNQGYSMSGYDRKKAAKHERVIKTLRWLAYT